VAERVSEVTGLFAQMESELVAWREAHPEATLDEIAAQVTPRRRQVMGALLAKLALQQGNGYALEGLRCEVCGTALAYKGNPAREVLLVEGEGPLARAYDHCPHCARGFFPLDRRLGLVQRSWTPETIAKALRLAVDIPSYRRAAESFEALTQVPLSKSSLQGLVQEYGGRLVEQEAQQAEALCALPAGEWDGRPLPCPPAAGETMAVSLDGVMMNVRGEGWKEAKIAALSVVEQQEGSPEPEVQLTEHSYCAGLWDAATFGRQQWAEAWRRGLPRARCVVAVSDGAAWIWALVITFFAPCVQIIDWWHAVQRVWAIAFAVYGQGTPLAAPWGARLKALLWAGDLRGLVHELRAHWPRGRELPDGLRQALGYLFRQRRRMRYPLYRQAGYPIGSGTVEAGCKVVVQERLVQRGMRWSRSGAQALLALRCALLSGRWDVTWQSLAPAQVT